MVDAATGDAAEAVQDADLVIVCVPIGAYGEVGHGDRAASQARRHRQRCRLGQGGRDARSRAAYSGRRAISCPAIPIAGTEHSGPGAGLVDLFDGRWCILTPTPGTDAAAIEKIAALWRACGSNVEIMDPAHHDQVLAITSHLPHLIAYTIVGTATDLEDTLQQEVIKFSASGFRDFTRIAASDPTMWRDIFLNNREAVLEVLQRFTEDLTALQRAIRWGEGDKLFELFSRTRAIRRSIIDAKQA